jgi:UTP--glucose-1-phosphate uridylyltransferase
VLAAKRQNEVVCFVMNAPIRKAVFPVAGLGTRFLPATKAMPKEMLTVVDRPLIQYAVDEALAAGIEDLIMVTGRNKAVIEDHFDVPFELEAALRQRGKTEVLETLARELPEPGRVSFTRQQVPLGLGHAVWCARELVGDEPFAVLLPDMIMRGQPGCLAQMVAVYKETGGNIVAVEECDPAETAKYGIVGVGEPVGEAFRITEMVEKPDPKSAPSNLYVNGRYILQPEIFAELGRKQRGAGNEIQLTDAMVRLSQSQSFYGSRFQGRTFDCGSTIGFLAANIAFALDREEIAEEFAKEARKLLDQAKA